MSRLQEIRDTAAKLSATPATEGNLVSIVYNIVEALNLIAEELAEHMEDYPGQAIGEPTGVEITDEKPRTHKKASKKKSGD